MHVGCCLEQHDGGGSWIREFMWSSRPDDPTREPGALRQWLSAVAKPYDMVDLSVAECMVVAALSSMLAVGLDCEFSYRALAQTTQPERSAHCAAGSLYCS